MSLICEIGYNTRDECRIDKGFSREEVSTTLHQMGTLKASGLDGFIADFFQKNWGLMKDEVCTVVIDILQSGVMPTTFNLTHIVLS